MPAVRLSRGGTSIARSDVVGCDAATSAHFIRHIALSTSETEGLRPGDSVQVNHMGPPLERNGLLAVHVHGTAELDDDELRQIELFIDEHDHGSMCTSRLHGLHFFRLRNSQRLHRGMTRRFSTIY